MFLILFGGFFGLNLAFNKNFVKSNIGFPSKDAMYMGRPLGFMMTGMVLMLIATLFQIGGFASSNEVIGVLFIFIGLWDEPIRMQNDKNAIGVLILQVWKNLPFALLILLGSIQSIGDDVIDAARDLGANSFARLKKIIAPLTISSMQAALIIIFIGALADFSFQSIAGPTNKYSLSQLMLYYKNNGRWHEAAGVGVTIMIISFLGAIFISYLTKFIFFLYHFAPRRGPGGVRGGGAPPGKP